MKQRWLRQVGVVGVAGALTLGLALGGSTVRAQDTGTPEADNGTPDTEMVRQHPVHIHAGTCDALGEVVFPLSDLTADEMAMRDMDTAMAATPDDTEMSDVDATPADDMMDGMDHDREVVASSTTVIPATFDIIFSADHAINVHESPENIQNYVACGDLRGDVSDDGTLTIELQELNDSGYEGRATLTDLGDETIEVVIELMEVETDSDEMDSEMTPEMEATPSA
jgi:hypothetical protein